MIVRVPGTLCRFKMSANESVYKYDLVEIYQEKIKGKRREIEGERNGKNDRKRNERERGKMREARSIKDEEQV